ncbi:hypothetical protein BT69DRAFT_1327285 [Atractiella rhizophila]|nr:hypothetical protein BT69DRAFT_1327285 [Atractiella rhizophila]
MFWLTITMERHISGVPHWPSCISADDIHTPLPPSSASPSAFLELEKNANLNPENKEFWETKDAFVGLGAVQIFYKTSIFSSRMDEFLRRWERPWVMLSTVQLQRARQSRTFIHLDKTAHALLEAFPRRRFAELCVSFGQLTDEEVEERDWLVAAHSILQADKMRLHIPFFSYSPNDPSMRICHHASNEALAIHPIFMDYVRRRTFTNMTWSFPTYALAFQIKIRELGVMIEREEKGFKEPNRWRWEVEVRTGIEKMKEGSKLYRGLAGITIPLLDLLQDPRRNLTRLQIDKVETVLPPSKLLEELHFRPFGPKEELEILST